MQEMQIKKVYQLEICNKYTAIFRKSECSMLPPTSIKHRKSKKESLSYESLRGRQCLIFATTKKRLEGNC